MKKLKYVLAAAVVLSLFIAARRLNLQEHLRDFLAWVQAQGIWAPVIFCLAYVLATVFFIPGSILTLGAGFLFGVIRGSILVSVASVSGAAAAFLIGRYFARRAVEKKIGGNKKFTAIDNAVAERGWKIVLLTRLSPVFPFNLLNYAFGLTKVSFAEYVLASWIGMVPGTVLYVYLGSLAQSLASLGAGPHRRSPAEWSVYVLGFLATAAVTFYVTKTAKRALAHPV